MPFAAPTLCTRPGCRELGRHSHSRREYDKRRGGSTARGYGARWRKRRKISMMDPESAICRIHWEVLGQVVPAEHRDHIVAKSKGGNDDDANLQWLCATCNSSKGDRDDQEFRAALRHQS